MNPFWKEAKAYVPSGISKRKVHVPSESEFHIPEQATENRRMIIQEHHAHRAGKHLDIRMDIRGKGVSWATRHGLPEAGKPRMWYQQPAHRMAYFDFEGEIPRGQYGAGKVRKVHDANARITARPGRIDFAVHSGPHEGNYVLIHRGGINWLAVKRKEQAKTAAVAPLAKTAGMLTGDAWTFKLPEPTAQIDIEGLRKDLFRLQPQATPEKKQAGPIQASCESCGWLSGPSDSRESLEDLIEEKDGHVQYGAPKFQGSCPWCFSMLTMQGC